MSPRASVLIPCHDKAETLPLTVDTVLRQHVADVEVLLIGDGVTDGVRAAIGGLTADERVRFLDLPKGPHHGEIHRHTAILEARSDAIFYLCDDDLLLPDHVGDLLGLLETSNLVQSFNGYVRPDGRIWTYAADLSSPASVEPMLVDHPRQNAVSITGTAHRRAFYLEVGEPWDTTPAGEWPDLHQWRRLMRHPAFRGATSDRMTALQFPTSADGRDAWTPQERYDELVAWHRVVTGDDGQAVVDEGLRRGALDQLVTIRPTYEAQRVVNGELRTRVSELHALVVELVETKRTLTADNERLRERVRILRQRVRRLRRRLDPASRDAPA